MVERVGSTSKGYASAKMRTDAHQQVSICCAVRHSKREHKNVCGGKRCGYNMQIQESYKPV
eukprot:582286-Pelagomonas_calceolata.AAC.2